MGAGRAAVVGVLLATSALAACSGQPPVPGASPAPASPAATSPAATAPSTTASASISPTASSPRPTGQPSTPSPSASRPTGFTTAAKRGGAAPSPASLLRVVRAGRNAGYDRVVFELLSFGIGIDERAPFRVLRLTGPGRIVVDVAAS